MLIIVPNEDGEMVAVPIHVQGENDEDDESNMEVNMDGGENADSEARASHLLTICDTCCVLINSLFFRREFNSSN